MQASGRHGDGRLKDHISTGSRKQKANYRWEETFMKFSEPTSSDTLLSARPHLINLQEYRQPETKHKNASD